jgi:hypothetical protein
MAARSQLTILILAALKVRRSGSARQVVETIAGVTKRPRYSSVLVTLRRLSKEGIVEVTDGFPMIWRLP